MGEKRIHWLPVVQVDFNMPVKQDGRIGTTFKSWYEEIKVGGLVFQACIEEDKEGDGELFGVLARVTKKKIVTRGEEAFRPVSYYVWSRPLAWDNEDVVDADEA